MANSCVHVHSTKAVHHGGGIEIETHGEGTTHKLSLGAGLAEAESEHDKKIQAAELAVQNLKEFTEKDFNYRRQAAQHNEYRDIDKSTLQTVRRMREKTSDTTMALPRVAPAPAVAADATADVR